ncbi:MAG: dephospho-CoA kinase [Rhodospirillaceae bacterium]|nr:dephospho-CoA kinase [Rhodospirillaceae bacterium]
MIVLGLTGSIAMGKSTAASAFRRLGVPVHDADDTVHRLMGKGGDAVAKLARTFPDALKDGAIDRAVLRKRVLDDPKALKRLESILHPLVRRSERAFLAAARRRREPLVVLDIPLLYETGGDKRCDAVAVVSAPRSVQLARLKRRRGFTKEWLKRIEARQLPDAEKRRRADFVIPTGLDLRRSLQAIRTIVTMAKDGRIARRRR